MDDELMAFENKKCHICGGWKDVMDLWINSSRGLCPGHSIEPALPTEPAQYEQALVSYELCEVKA